MKRQPGNRHTLVGTLLALFCLPALPLRGGVDAVAFGPPDGASLTKEFSTQVEFAIDEAEIYMNGAEIEPEMIGIPTDLVISFGYELGLRDDYEEVADGRPIELVRTYETFDGWSVDPDGSEERNAKDEVLDDPIRFSWDEDSETYEIAFEDGDGDEEALLMLSEDLDLRALLPDAEVDEDESWDVSGDGLLTLLLPGFDFTTAEDWGEKAPPAGLVRAIERLAELVGTCTYVGTTEEDGRTLAEIDFKFTADDGFELDPEDIGMNAGEGAPQFDESLLEITVDVEFEGTCLWDVAAGHFHSFELAGNGSIVLDASVTIESVAVELEGTVEFALDLERSASATPVE